MAPHAVPLARLRPNPNNPRRITPQKLKMLQAAMQRFGDLSGIVYNTRTSQLVGGHQRVATFQALGAQPTITHTYEAPTQVGTVREGHIACQGERFAYREVDWDEATEAAANLAANKGAGTFDLPMLQEALHGLDALNFDLDFTLFDDTERANLLTGAPGTAEEIDLSRAESFRVAVDCRDAQHQAEVMQQLEDLGLHPKASMT